MFEVNEQTLRCYRIRKLFWGGVIFVLLLYIFLPGYLRLERAREEIREYREKNNKLREENLKLKKEIWALKNDPLYIEEMSRKELGYARDGEIIYEIEMETEDEDSH